MKDCFGYLRVSSKKQGEGTSLTEQREAVEAFATRHGVYIAKWYVETVTAAKRGRPQFNAMIKALRRGQAAGVVMHKIDRSARNFFDWAKIGELSDAGVEVHFATESLDFRSRGGRLAANVQMAVAEDYCRNLREEVRKGQAGCLKRGLYPFKAPIGYLDNGKGQLKTPDPERAPLVQQAFELYASGRFSTRTLRKKLNEMGLRNQQGGLISKGCLEKALQNPFYTGLIKIRRTGAVYPGGHEPLISTQLFQAVQDVRAGKSGKKVTRHQHTYRGLFKCADCGRSMIPEKQKQYVYYRCQTRTCPGNIVREERLEDAIFETLRRAAIGDDDSAAIEATIERWERERQRSDADSVHAMQLAKTKQRLEALTDALLDGVIDNKTYTERREKLLLEHARLKEAQKTHEQRKTQPTLLRGFLERIKSLAEHYRFAAPAEKREIAEIATSNRKVKAKNVYLEPANWLRSTEIALAGFSCADARTSSRTKLDKTGAVNQLLECSGGVEAHIEQLIEAANSPEAAQIMNFKNQHNLRSDTLND